MSKPLSRKKNPPIRKKGVLRPYLVPHGNWEKPDFCPNFLTDYNTGLGWCEERLQWTDVTIYTSFCAKGNIKLFSIYPDLNHETLRRPGLAWNRNEQCISKAQRVRNAALLCNQTLCFRKRCAITKYSKVQTDAAIHQRSTRCEVQHFRNQLM